jgi:uncharacterized protein
MMERSHSAAVDSSADTAAEALVASQPAAALLGRVVILGLSLAIALLASTFAPTSGISSIAATMPVATFTLAGVLAAIFAGALVSGLAGFAFSAVAGAILLRLITPAETVSLLLICSIGAQLVAMANLLRSIKWREVLPLVAAGMLGIPIGGFMLQALPASVFVAGFGCFLVGYSAFMLIRPVRAIRCQSRIPLLVSCFIGGITGGAIAFPGAVPTIWCCMQDLPKTRQRSLMQPFILLMQVATVIYFSGIGLMTTETLLVSLVCAPAILVGTWLGLCLYHRCSDGQFRQLVLVILLICGAILL